MDNYITIDTDKLRNDLINYFGAAYFNANRLAIIELSKIESSSDEEIVKIAINNGFNLNNYRVENDYSR